MWIKINSEKDLPKPYETVWFCTDEGETKLGFYHGKMELFRADQYYAGQEFDSETWTIEQVKHWIRPNKPMAPGTKSGPTQYENKQAQRQCEKLLREIAGG